MLIKVKSDNMIINKEHVIQRWLQFYVQKVQKGEKDNYDDSQDEDLLDMVHTAEPLDELLSDVEVEIVDGLKNGKAAGLDGIPSGYSNLERMQ